MIGFKQYLDEGRDYPLYKGISTKTFEEVIRNDFYEARFVHDIDTYHKSGKQWQTISFTRNFEFAKRWDSIVVEVDHRKLSQRYKIMPYSYFANIYGKMSGIKTRARPDKGGKRNFNFINQFEEMIVFEPGSKKGIKNFTKYIRKVYIQKYEKDRLSEVIDKLKRNGIEIEFT